MFKRKWFGFVSMILVMSLLAACASGAANENDGAIESSIDKATIALSSDVLSLDPHMRDSTIDSSIAAHIFSPLVSRDNDMNLKPALAERWEVKDDGVTWVFHLRKDVKFHNGNDFNADDVMYSFNRILDSDILAVGVYLVQLKDIKKIDDYTVEMTTQIPYPMFANSLRQVMVIDKESSEGLSDEAIAESPNGTGRYLFVEHVKEDHLALEVNPDYWGELPEFEEVVFRPISNEATRTAAMLSGEVDMAVDISVMDVERMEAEESVQLISNPSLRCIFLNLDVFRTDSPGTEGENPLLDRKVRQAIYHAIDVEAIVENVMGGHAYPATTYIPSKANGADPSKERYGFDPEKAKSLLAEAGYPDGFKLIFDAPNNRYVNDEKVAQAIASYLTRAGIDVELNLMPKSLYFDYISTNDQNSSFMMSGWADGSGEGAVILADMIYTLEGKPGYGSANRGHYSNPEVDKLIDQALTTQDSEERAKLVMAADKIAYEDVAYIPLYFQQDIYAVAEGFKYHPEPVKLIYAWNLELIK